MTLEEVKKELKVFDKYKFFEDGHYYTCNGVKVGQSVTRLIEEYANEFNQQEIAEKVALRDNKSVVEVLEEWKYKNQFACNKGTTCHEFAQAIWSGEEYNEILFDGSIEYINAVNIIQRQAKQFYKDFKDKLIHIKDEQLVGDEDFDICSAIDHLFMDNKGNVYIIDYKTNSVLKGYNDDEKNRRYTKKMLIPFNYIDDDSLHHYHIQLSIYKYLIEKNTNIKIKKLIIVYMSENINNYELIEVPYLEKEARLILENRRVKNMQSIAVLLIGGSGTGKTSSFRNMPSNETAIINVTNKPLPYKDKGQKVVSTKDYTQIISAIKGTKKRALIIDDSGYLMSFENFDKASIKGYDKFTTMAQNYYKLIEASRDLDNEKICYIVMHEEVDEDGKLKPKAIGKMLNQQLCIEGLFTIVLRYKYENGQYLIQTKNDGSSVVKTPIDLFEENEVPNDLYEIDKKIRDYYGFKQLDDNSNVEN